MKLVISCLFLNIAFIGTSREMNLLPQSGQTGEVAVGDHASPCRPLLATPSPFPRWDGEEASHSLGETSKLPPLRGSSQLGPCHGRCHHSASIIDAAMWPPGGPRSCSSARGYDKSRRSDNLKSSPLVMAQWKRRLPSLAGLGG